MPMCPLPRPLSWLVSAALVVAPVAIGAQPVRITIDGAFPGASPIAGVTTGPFQLTFETSLRPAPTNIGSAWFELTGLTADFLQHGATTRVTGMSGFFTSDVLGGFSFGQTGQPVLLATQGAMLFTGPLTAPVFTLGTFAVSDLVPLPATAQRITIASVAVVPEPSAGVLVATGLLVVGGLMRRRLAAAHGARDQHASASGPGE